MYPTEEGRAKVQTNIQVYLNYVSTIADIVYRRLQTILYLSVRVSYRKALNTYTLFCQVYFYAELFQDDTKVVQEFFLKSTI